MGNEREKFLSMDTTRYMADTSFVAKTMRANKSQIP